MQYERNFKGEHVRGINEVPYVKKDITVTEDNYLELIPSDILLRFKLDDTRLKNEEIADVLFSEWKNENPYICSSYELHATELDGEDLILQLRFITEPFGEEVSPLTIAQAWLSELKNDLKEMKHLLN